MKSEAFEMQAGSTYSGPIAIIAVEEKNPKVKRVAAKVGERVFFCAKISSEGEANQVS